jgi:hypothetical protein
MRWRVLLKHEKLERKIQKECLWHKWFAWRPIRVLDSETGHTYKVWLEYVGRKKGVFSQRIDYGVKVEFVGRPIYCFEEDLVYNALVDNEIIDNRGRE